MTQHSVAPAGGPGRAKKRRMLRRARADTEKTDIWTGLLKAAKKKLVSALVGAVLGVSGVIAFWISPLKGAVMHMLWRESALLTVHTSQRALRVGDQAEVYVEVTPNSHIPVSEGVLYTTASNDTGLVFKSGLNASTTPQIGAPMILPKNDRPVFQATIPGHFTVAARLHTEFGDYTAQASVDVSPINQPTIQNLSGDWHVTIGSALGKMELIHRGADVSGIYNLAQPHTNGSIAGFVDGKTFNADFVDQGETRRKWLVRALYLQSESFVEIKGHVTRWVLANNDWIAAGEPQEFYATSVPKP